MTPIERIEHIRQCLRRMNPVLGSELAGAAAIEKELQALETLFARLESMVDGMAAEYPGCGGCACPVKLATKTSASLNGAPCV